MTGGALGPVGVSHFVDAILASDALRVQLRHHEVLPPRRPEFSAQLPPGFAAVERALSARGIDRLYSHQQRSLELLEAGSDVVLATPTASGKTLVYNLPVLRSILADAGARALYIFPLKALERDQHKRLVEEIAALGHAAAHARVAIYDGDTPAAARSKIRADPPQVLITTPDMLHVGILPNHEAWRRFFAGLRFVVVDELHTYRGIFGSHVAQVLRRLDRVAASHGARFQIVAASATIANPGELAADLTGRRFEVVQSDGAPRTRRHVLLFNPDGSPYSLATRLFRLSVGLGLRTIAFTKARLIAELIHTWVVEAEPALASQVSCYRAGFLPEERREIERRLFTGELTGVISTSALEMGIDVGGLDVCLLVGYPGSQIATWQRSGRVGRARDAAIALIAQSDALDQYLVAHPRAFLDRGFEHAVIDPHNTEVTNAHLPCAAAERPLRAGEAWLDSEALRSAVARLEDEGALLRSDSGAEWFPARRFPHRDVNLRSVGASYAIALDGERGRRSRTVGSIGAARVFAECHEGAIYLHRGQSYLVTELDRDARRVRVRPIDAAYYTRTLSQKETEIRTRDRARPAGNFRLAQGRLRVTTTITGFERRRVRGQDLLGTEPLKLPPTSFETVGIWLELPNEVTAAVRAAGGHPMGGLHALEHAALSLFPLFALCDRSDVGGISYTRHRQLERAAVFFYDHHAGGVGLAASLFDRVEALLDATLDVIRGCACERGCPGCVHSPKCGSGNRPIDKSAAMHTLRILLDREPMVAPEPAEAATSAPRTVLARPAHERRPSVPPPQLLHFDLETQRSAAEVGGWHNAHLMRVSVAVLYDSRRERFESFREGDVAALLARLREADLVVGFNVRSFDYRVLRGYSDVDLGALPTFDMLDAIHRRLGFRIPLGHLAEETLGVPKSADGLQALRWWKEGKVEEIERYCRKDVELLRDLFRHAEQHGYLRFRTRTGDRVRIPARWRAAELIEQARAERRGSAPL